MLDVSTRTRTFAASECKLIGLSYPDKDYATWREIVVLRHHGVVHMHNLVSHGRRMYRKLVYSSNTAFSLHGKCALPVEPSRSTVSVPCPSSVPTLNMHMTMCRSSTETVGEIPD